MITLLFSLTCVLFGFQCVFFVWRFVHHRKKFNQINYSSLVCACNSLGWLFAVARELKIAGHVNGAVLLAAAATFGLLGDLLIAHTQAQHAKRGMP